jgi:hypothetical protein
MILALSLYVSLLKSSHIVLRFRRSLWKHHDLMGLYRCTSVSSLIEALESH